VTLTYNLDTARKRVRFGEKTWDEKDLHVVCDGKDEVQYVAPVHQLGAPLADFTDAFPEPLYVAFLSQNVGPTANWFDTSVYGYSADGKTDKFNGTEGIRIRSDEKDAIGSMDMGQMKFSNVPKTGRSYRWQSDAAGTDYFGSGPHYAQGKALMNRIARSISLKISRTLLKIAR
jgi:hypothetical protein